MKLTLRISFFLVVLLSNRIIAKNAIPDSLQKGVIVKSYKIKEWDKKSLKSIKPDSLYFYKHTDQAGLADWKNNFYFLPKAPTYTVLSGYIDIPATKSYVFKLQNVDGAIFYIDNKEIINNDGVREFSEKDGEVYLTKGLHPFRITSFQSGNPREFHEVSLAWYIEEEERFDWVDPKYFYFSKKENTSKLVPVKSETAGISLENDNLHPSYNHFPLHNSTFNPKVGGMDFLSKDKLVLCTWDPDGQVFIVENPSSNDSSKIKVKRIAWGLAEPLGLKVVNNKIYVLQKHELTELVDTDGDEIIDEYNSICNSWGALGNFHEFAFGLVYKDGYFYAALATAINPGGKSTIPQNKDRGKAVKIGMDGSIEYLANGLRTPNGVGLGIDDEIFITDNQGDWLPACKMVHLKKGAFYGSYSVDLYSIGKLDEKLPVVWFPQGEIGNSTSQPTTLNDGPYKGQMLVGDVTHGGLKRIFIEKVNGEYQGCVFQFSQGLTAGVNRLTWGPDGALYIGGIGSSGNWGQYGKKPYGLDRIKYNGKSTFEMLAVRAKQNGLEIEFTEPVDEKVASLPESYEIVQWRYVPTMNYGGPKVDSEIMEISSISISADKKKVFIELNGLKDGHVASVSLVDGFKNKEGKEVFTKNAWYTLNKVPKEKGVVSVLPGKTKTAGNTKKTTVSVKEAPKVAKDPYAMLTKEEEQKIIALGPNLITKSGCYACHAMDKKVLGPSFKMVSEKYSNDPATLKKLTYKIYDGGGGVWGDYAMGAQSHLKKDDITKMVRYILSLK